MIHTVKGFSVVNEADVFLEFPCFFYDLMDVGDLISGSSAFSKSSLHIWKFLVYILLKPSLEDFEHDLASMWNEHNCAVIWTFFDIALLWDWKENWPFPVLWPVPVNSRYFLTFYFCIPVPYDEKVIFFCCCLFVFLLVLEGLVALHGTVQRLQH